MCLLKKKNSARLPYAILLFDLHHLTPTGVSPTTPKGYLIFLSQLEAESLDRHQTAAQHARCEGT